MKNQFLKSSELTLNPAGYLISKESSNPVTLDSFVEQQRKAEYIVKLAKAIEGKNFTLGKLDDLEAIKAEVKASITNVSKRNYVTLPSAPTSKVNDEMVEYALNFASYLEKKSNLEKVNDFMAQFNKIYDVENVGDYFQEGLVQLNQIYSVDEVLAAVTATIDILN